MRRVLSSYKYSASLRFLSSCMFSIFRKSPAVFSFAGDPFSLFKSDGFYRRFSFKFGRISAAFVLKSVGIYGKIL